MTFANKDEMLGFVQADEETKAAVGDLLWRLYSNSPVLASAFDAMADANHSLEVNIVTGSAVTQGWANGIAGLFLTQEHYVGTPSNKLQINLSQVADSWFIAADGTLRRNSLERVVAHELYHSLTGHTDPAASYIATGIKIGTVEIPPDPQGARDWLAKADADLEGDTVTFENGVGAILGGADGWERAGYFAALANFSSDYDSVGNAGQSLSDGNTLALAYNDFPGGGTIDFHVRSGVALVLAHEGNDTVVGSQGNRAELTALCVSTDQLSMSGSA